MAKKPNGKKETLKKALKKKTISQLTDELQPLEAALGKKKFAKRIKKSAGIITKGLKEKEIDKTKPSTEKKKTATDRPKEAAAKKKSLAVKDKATQKAKPAAPKQKPVAAKKKTAAKKKAVAVKATSTTKSQVSAEKPVEASGQSNGQ